MVRVIVAAVLEAPGFPVAAGVQCSPPAELVPAPSEVQVEAAAVGQRVVGYNELRIGVISVGVALHPQQVGEIDLGVGAQRAPHGHR